MTAAIFGIIGVVVGSVLTAVLNYFLQKSLDNRRWEREDRQNFQQERVRVYRELLIEADRVEKLKTNLITEDDWSRILSEIDMFSSSLGVRLAAREMAFHATEVERTTATSDKIKDWHEAQQKLREARGNFGIAAREELGIKELLCIPIRSL